jgi:hypothetical protein
MLHIVGTNIGLRCADPTYKTNVTPHTSSLRQDFSSALDCTPFHGAKRTSILANGERHSVHGADVARLAAHPIPQNAISISGEKSGDSTLSG